MVDAARQLEFDRKVKRLEQDKKNLESRLDHAHTEIETLQKQLEFTKVFEAGVKWQDLERLESAPGGDSTAILVCTDWHIEETVHRDTTNGVNHYNLKIAEKRQKALFEKFVRMLDWVRHFADVQHVVVACLGDFINGYIHEEYLETNECSPSEACLIFRDWIASGLKFIAKETQVPTIDVVTANGNHGRTTPKQRVKTDYKNSYEWMTYNFLAKEFEGDSRYRFRIGKAYHNWLKIQGHDVRFHHGQAIRYQGGVGGIAIPVNKAIAAWDKQRTAALDIFGHWHQFQNHVKWVSVGSLIGYNEYTIQIKGSFEPPSQGFVLLSKKYGNTIASQIFVS